MKDYFLYSPCIFFGAVFLLAVQWQQEYYINNLTFNQPEIGDIVKGWREVLDSYDDSDDDNDNYK